MSLRLPHPIPYQGSKRSLAPLIRPYIPSGIERFYEPFAGSAAMTIFAAHHQIARQYIIADALAPIVDLLQLIVEKPNEVASSYKEIWLGQNDKNFDYFNEVRARFNAERSPVDLLYLICRCVKNAIRFNAAGNFTQSVDKRRLGMNPSKMSEAVAGVSFLLRGKVEFRIGDWMDTTNDAGPGDFLYLDPPYFGTSVGRDKRYFQQLSLEQLTNGIQSLNQRSVRFALSYDGMTGEKVYGPPLSKELYLKRLLLYAGTSSQSTLSGKKEDTVESLYLSQSIPITEPKLGILGKKEPVRYGQRMFF